MRILVTCGPSHEPIDGARRLTNMSTGRLGLALAEALVQRGHRVTCLRGEGSTWPIPDAVGPVRSFTTNDSLAALLIQLSAEHEFDAVFHSAALCDYRVARATDAGGIPIRSPKIATRNGRLVLELEPAVKLLPQLRGWFPSARIVGWKYELAGAPVDAFARAWRQIRDHATDASVLNGAAHGPGFSVCHRNGEVRPCPDRRSLCEHLGDWLEAGIPAIRSRLSWRPVRPAFAARS